MTQSIESMIEVLQAYKDGKTIEWACNKTDDWDEIYHDAPHWDFDKFQYRIAPEPKKKVKLIAFIDVMGNMRWVKEDIYLAADYDCIRVPSEDKEIEL